MRNLPAIVAVGRTKFGEHYGKEPEKLIEEAWLTASKDSGIERRGLEACYLSDCFLPITNKLGLEEGFLSELTELHVPMEVTRSVSAALVTACHAIQAGVYKTVLVGGIEKMTDRWDKIRDDLMLLEDPWSYYAGGTPEANHELMLRAYIRKYGLTGENLEKLKIALAQIAVKNHANAVKNEYAQFQRAITVEQVFKARKASRKSLGLYDFAPISDGASALILTSDELAKKITDKPVYVLGHSSATDFLNFPARDDLTHFIASKTAMRNSFSRAEISPKDVQLLELYDQSTFMELIALEDVREKLAARVRIKLNAEEVTKEKVSQIVSLCRNHKGKSPVYISIKTGKGKVHATAGKQLSINPNVDFCRKMRKLLGAENFQLTK